MIRDAEHDTDSMPNDAPAAPLCLIGIGLLGTAIAERLLHAGRRVIGWDIDPDRRSALASLGGTVAYGVAGAVGSCGRVLLSLPTHEAVAAVLASAGDALRAGQSIIDTSTGDPEASADQARKLSARGVAYLDASVSGSSRQMRDGEAVLMVGADATAFHACRDVFDCLASRTFYTGPPGSGSRMKLVTNLVLGLNRAALAEGLAFACSVGVDPSAALEVLGGSMAYSRVMDVKGRKMIDGDFVAQARLSQHLKDVRLILREAARAGLALPLSEAHRELLERAEAAGLGGLDNSAVIEVIRGPRP